MIYYDSTHQDLSFGTKIKTFGSKKYFWSKIASRDPYFWPQNEVFLMKISLFLQLANFFVGHTYFGSRQLHFKPKFDPVAQTVQELDTNICAARGDKLVFREYFFPLNSELFFLFHILILAHELYILRPSLTV